MLLAINELGNKFNLLSDKQGIMNGDVGKISGFYFGSELEFLDESGNNDKSVRDSFANNDDENNITIEMNNNLIFFIFSP